MRTVTLSADWARDHLDIDTQSNAVWHPSSDSVTLEMPLLSVTPQEKPKKYGIITEDTIKASNNLIKYSMGYNVTQEIIDDDIHNMFNPQESKMQVYDYVIVRTTKGGKFKEIDDYGRILAQSETHAKMKLAAQYGESYEADRLEVLVRPF